MMWWPFLLFLILGSLPALDDRGAAAAVIAASEPHGRPPGFVWIKPGTVTMGAPAAESRFVGNEGPPAQVTIGQGLWMGQHQVTQAEYLQVTGNNPSRFKGDLKRPVEMVSWFDATNYCGKVTEREQRAGKLPGGYVYRLPTGPEWEYACRAATTNPVAFGNGSGRSELSFNENFPFVDPRQDPKIENTAVGFSGEPNAWGLYDMHGDVWEWCSDWFEGQSSGAGAAGSKNIVTSPGLVVRGGNWYFYARSWRSAFRDGYYPDCGYLNFGFRVVLAPGQY